MLANGQGERSHGKCNRKQTAAGFWPAARMKRCGKSAPAPQRCGGLANPIGSNAKAKNSLRVFGCAGEAARRCAGKRHEAFSNERPGEMMMPGALRWEQNPAYTRTRTRYDFAQLTSRVGLRSQSITKPHRPTREVVTLAISSARPGGLGRLRHPRP